MAIFIILVWIGLCLVIGGLAKSRGRDGLGWGFLAVVISPILAAIILLLLPDLEELEARRRRKEKKKAMVEDERRQEELRISAAEFALSIEKMKQLCDKGLFSDFEYSSRKKSLINSLKNRILTENPEIFLGRLVPLFENGALTKDEMDMIKSNVFPD